MGDGERNHASRAQHPLPQLRFACEGGLGGVEPYTRLTTQKIIGRRRVSV